MAEIAYLCQHVIKNGRKYKLNPDMQESRLLIPGLFAQVADSPQPNERVPISCRLSDLNIVPSR